MKKALLCLSLVAALAPETGLTAEDVKALEALLKKGED